MRRGANRAEYRREDLLAVLDAGTVAHVGVSTDDGPIVLPMAYARTADRMYLHGAAGNANRRPYALAEPLARLDDALAAEGRRRGDDFTLSLCPYSPLDRTAVAAYAEAGVDRLIALCMAFTPDDLEQTLDQLVADVLEPAKAA